MTTVRVNKKNTVRLFLSWNFSLLFFAINAFAADSQPVCSPKSYTDLLNCAVQRSAEIQISEQQLRATTELEGVAEQWLNPELSAERVQKGSDQSETTASLMFEMRLGGKGAAKVSEARAEIKKSQATHDLRVAEKRLNLTLKLHRLSHIESEIKVEEESVLTFRKIVSQFQKKAAFSPEQEVSLAVFRMALSDHQFSLVKLKNEEEQQLQELIASSNLTKEIILGNLPTRRTSWPALSSQVIDTASPHLRIVQSELNLAQSQKDIADAEAWPNFKVGPAAKFQQAGGSTENFFGLSLSMPLPIFSLNQSGMAYGRQKLTEAELNYNWVNRKVSASREILLKKYQSIVSALETSLSSKFTEEKHTQVERLFFRGLVPSALVIEAHRQLFDLEIKRNELEREAIEALGSIYIIENQFSEVVL